MKTIVRVSVEEVARIVMLAVMARSENRMRHCAAVECDPGLEVAPLSVIVFDTMQAAQDYGKAQEVHRDIPADGEFQPGYPGVKS